MYLYTFTYFVSSSGEKNATFFGFHFFFFPNKKISIENVMWNNAWLEKKR